MSKKDDQIIYTVPNVIVTRHCRKLPEGFTKSPDAYRVLDPIYVRWKRRGDAETNEKFRQVIPYVVVSRTTLDGSKEYVSYVRAKGGGESRLHSKVSIGIGGHMEQFDKDFRDSMWREVALEEIIFKRGDQTLRMDEMGLTPHHMHYVGMISMDTTPVDRVHVGAVFVVNIPGEFHDVKPASTDSGLSSVEWMSTTQLLDKSEQLENWSRVLVDHPSMLMREVLRPVFPAEPGNTMASIEFHATRGMVARSSPVCQKSYDSISAIYGNELCSSMVKKFTETESTIW